MGFWSGTGCGRAPPLIAGGVGTCCGVIAIFLIVMGNQVSDVVQNEADSDWKAATCMVMASTWKSFFEKQQAGRSQMKYACSFIVSTSLTGDRNFTLAGAANKDGCIQFGTRCNYDVPRHCQGDCWVVYDGDNIVEISIMSKTARQVVRTGVSIALLVIGAILACCCCLMCCGAIVSGTLQVLEERDTETCGEPPCKESESQTTVFGFRAGRTSPGEV
eukprot:TRINITY_DN41768_c0_g1_i1.p1 TRINITY_DN41768_c0_g1~~TRINITY_DN41768_c0_g1_i1.p1  ORF type:complete len:218 (-),score=14.18 TRINITY_DN41768_c0_g1_i1:40-693(-)